MTTWNTGMTFILLLNIALGSDLPAVRGSRRSRTSNIALESELPAFRGSQRRSRVSNDLEEENASTAGDPVN